ncbi:MAG: hypothetical protein QM758_29230 [Armatimonas sp.]
MSIFRRTEYAEAPSPALEELEGSLAGLVRLGVLLLVDISGVSGASSSTFDEAIESALTRVRALLMDGSLSARQTDVLGRVSRTLSSVNVVGRSAPHLQRLPAYLANSPMNEQTHIYIRAVREQLVAVGTPLVGIVRSRDSEGAHALAESLRLARRSLEPANAALLEAASSHQGVSRLCRAAVLALDVTWDGLDAVREEYSYDLSREAATRDGLLAPLRRAV